MNEESSSVTEETDSSMSIGVQDKDVEVLTRALKDQSLCSSQLWRNRPPKAPPPPVPLAFKAPPPRNWMVPCSGHGRKVNFKAPPTGPPQLIRLPCADALLDSILERVETSIAIEENFL